MWKPLRLQVTQLPPASLTEMPTLRARWIHGAAGHCLFGLSITGYPWLGPRARRSMIPPGQYSCDPAMTFRWIAYRWRPLSLGPPLKTATWRSSLQEPSLMGALEEPHYGTVKGVIFPAQLDAFGVGAATPGAFPTGPRCSKCQRGSLLTLATSSHPYPSNFNV